MSYNDAWYAQPLDDTPAEKTARQIMHLAATNAELIMALEEIAKKRKLDAVAAASMKAIAMKALNAAGIRC